MLARLFSSKRNSLKVSDYLFVVTMSRLILEKELSLIRQRLEAIEEALGEELTLDDKQLLTEALKEHKAGKSIPFRPPRLGNRKQ